LLIGNPRRNYPAPGAWVRAEDPLWPAAPAATSPAEPATPGLRRAAFLRTGHEEPSGDFSGRAFQDSGHGAIRTPCATMRLRGRELPPPDAHVSSRPTIVLFAGRYLHAWAAFKAMGGRKTRSPDVAAGLVDPPSEGATGFPIGRRMWTPVRGGDPQPTCTIATRSVPEPLTCNEADCLDLAGGRAAGGARVHALGRRRTAGGTSRRPPKAS